MEEKYNKINHKEFEKIKAENNKEPKQYDLQKLPQDLQEAVTGIKLLATIDTDNVFEKFVSLVGLCFDFIKPYGAMIVRDNVISDEKFDCVKKIDKELEEIEENELDKIVKKCPKEKQEKIFIAFKKLRLLVFHTLLYSTHIVTYKKDGYLRSTGQTISYDRANSFAGEPSFTVKDNTEWVSSSSTEEAKGRMKRWDEEYEYYTYAEQKIYEEIKKIDKNYYGDTRKKPGTNRISKAKISYDKESKSIYSEIFKMVSNTYAYCSTDYEELKKYIKIGFNVDYEKPKYSGKMYIRKPKNKKRRKVSPYTGRESIFEALYNLAEIILPHICVFWITIALIAKAGLWVWNLLAHGSTPFLLTFVGIFGVTLAMISIKELFGLLSSIWVLGRSSKKLTLVDFK